MTDDKKDPPDDLGPDRDAIFEALYAEVRAVAHAYFRRERPGHTLRPTEIVHEAYFKFRDKELTPDVSRAQILGWITNDLRRILIDHHRKRNREIHGGKLKRTTLRTDVEGRTTHVIDYLALEEALTRLEQRPGGPLQVRCLLLRYVAGLKQEEIADELGISLDRLQKALTFARRFVGACLRDDPPLRVLGLPKPRK